MENGLRVFIRSYTVRFDVPLNFADSDVNVKYFKRVGMIMFFSLVCFICLFERGRGREWWSWIVDRDECEQTLCNELYIIFFLC